MYFILLQFTIHLPTSLPTCALRKQPVRLSLSLEHRPTFNEPICIVAYFNAHSLWIEKWKISRQLIVPFSVFWGILILGGDIIVTW